MTTLYIHIGTHKTGSTSIQEFFYNHRADLLRHGLVYPDIGMQGAGHHKLAWGCGLGEKHARNASLVRNALKKIENHLLQDDVDVVLSSEEFEYLKDLSQLEPFAKLPDVKIVLYVRRQDEMLESIYNQHVAMYARRFSGSIYQLSQGFNFFLILNYRAIAMRWANLFGADNVLVRPYNTCITKADVCEDFLDLVANDALCKLYRQQAAARKNMSLHPFALRTLGHMNRLALSEKQHRKLLRLLRQTEPLNPNARLLRPEDADGFYGRFSQSNALLCEEFLDSQEDLLASATRYATPPMWVNHENVEARELLDWVNRVVLGQC